MHLNIHYHALKYLLPDIQKWSGNKFTFQQDGAPAHCAWQTVVFLCLHVSEFVEPENCLSNSPHFKNPVEYLIWGALQQLVYRHGHIRDIEQLKEVLQTCWQQIGQGVINHDIGHSQTIVAGCRNQWRTHWAPLWLMFLVLNVHYHSYVFCCRNTELGQHK